MQVILTKDLPGLGVKNDLLSVKPGYGINYLIPQGFAVVANRINQKILAENIRQQAAKAKRAQLIAEELAQKVKDINLILSVRAGARDKIFGSITALQLAEAYNTHGIAISPKQIQISEPIKTLGKHEVTLALHDKVQVAIKFEVKAL